MSFGGRERTTPEARCLATVGAQDRTGGAAPSMTRGFWFAARAEPDRTAVVDAEERIWTAGELLAGANRLVHALRERGVRTGDPVATLTPNRAELLQTLLAV